ncbi:MAG: hypothetical protein R3F62_27700 [Planctomycetota bacterium]
MRLRVFAGLLTLGLAAGCSSVPSPERVQAWQAAELEAATGSEVHVVAETDPREAVDRARGIDLDMARTLALSLVAESPAEPDLLWRAARADADRVLLARAAGEAREARDLAALSGLDYARRAAELRAEDAAVQAQLAYALGTTTHLLPMGERSARATEVLATAQRALELDPTQPTALATQATVHLRLATLPWIARVFGSDIPPHDLDLAEAAARRALELEPCLEHRLLLAKVLVAREQEEAALELLRGAPASDEAPRDAQLRPELVALREDLE